VAPDLALTFCWSLIYSRLLVLMRFEPFTVSRAADGMAR
jgi:hypothetical protein